MSIIILFILLLYIKNPKNSTKTLLEIKKLVKMKKLDADSYSKLLKIYGEEMVNKTIEQLMDESSKNLSKFDYYVSKIISFDDSVSKNSFELYGMDLSYIPKLSKEENNELMKEIYEIINKIEILSNGRAVCLLKKCS